MKKKMNDLSCKMLSQISIRHTLDHLSKQFYYLAKLFLVFTKKQQHVFIIKAIINYPKRSKAILGVEMTNMGQTANFWGETNAAPLGEIFINQMSTVFNIFGHFLFEKIRTTVGGSGPTYHLMPIGTQTKKIIH